jgi:hypothetical protein
MFKTILKTFIISQIKKQPKFVELLVKTANKISDEPIRSTSEIVSSKQTTLTIELPVKAADKVFDEQTSSTAEIVSSKQAKLTIELLVKVANEISDEPTSSTSEIVSSKQTTLTEDTAPGGQVIFLEYPVNSRQRWDKQNPNPYLHNIINQNRELYQSELQAFLELSKYFVTIPKEHKDNAPLNEPRWINGWMPALDGVALYGFLVKCKPKLYIEIGSGNSTKFARKAIVDHALDTKIVSIDPCPRAEIDEICDEVIRKPVEEVNLEIFDRLDNNDILYIDNSHRVFMNSDATALFLDVLPRLKSGVLVQIHDITLPYDYPIEWIERYYSEQYVLAAYVLAKGELFDIILPNMFISNDKELKKILSPLWQKEEMANVETHGCSFWLRIK